MSRSDVSVQSKVFNDNLLPLRLLFLVRIHKDAKDGHSFGSNNKNPDKIKIILLYRAGEERWMQ